MDDFEADISFYFFIVEEEDHFIFSRPQRFLEMFVQTKTQIEYLMANPGVNEANETVETK